MARHARDSENIKTSRWVLDRLKLNETYRFLVGETVYDVRRIDYNDCLFIVDSYSSTRDKNDKSCVRHLLDKELETIFIFYILSSDNLTQRCVVCGGINLSYCASHESDRCTDCGEWQEAV